MESQAEKWREIWRTLQHGDTIPGLKPPLKLPESITLTPKLGHYPKTSALDESGSNRHNGAADRADSGRAVRKAKQRPDDRRRIASAPRAKYA